MGEDREHHQVRGPAVDVANELPEGDGRRERMHVEVRVGRVRVIEEHQVHPRDEEHPEEHRRDEPQSQRRTERERLARHLHRVEVQEEVLERGQRSAAGGRGRRVADGRPVELARPDGLARMEDRAVPLLVAYPPSVRCHRCSSASDRFERDRSGRRFRPPLQGQGIRGTPVDAERAPDAQLFLDDQGARGAGGGRLDAGDVLHRDDPDALLGADVDAAPAQDADRRLEHDVQEALQAARGLLTGLLGRVPQLDLRRSDPPLRELRRDRHPRVLGVVGRPAPHLDDREELAHAQ